VTADRPFTVLVVCTANLCRSPAAEAAFRAAWPGQDGVVVGSAGTMARPWLPMDPRMAELGAGAPPDFASRRADAALLAGSDLVLAMTRQIRSAVVQTAPAVVRRTFTLSEFADLALLGAEEGLGTDVLTVGARLARLVTEAPRLRVRRRSGDHDDVADPHGRAAKAYQRAQAQIEDAVGTIVTAVTDRGARGPSHPDGVTPSPEASRRAFPTT
jgi:protein-tyrosine phosphatase